MQLEVEDALADIVRSTVNMCRSGPMARSAGAIDEDYEDEYGEIEPVDELERGGDYAVTDISVVTDSVEPDEQSALADWLDAARSSAEVAAEADVRSREALYRAIGRAYDFSLAAARFPQDYAELLAITGWWHRNAHR